MNVFKSQKNKVSCKHRMDCPGIFNWHSKHNTKYSVLWKHKRGLPNGTQMKKCKNTPFGRPYKGKEVLLWKAGKVMVRLSIVKIEVWPFKTLFIYSYTLSLIPLGHFFFYCTGRLMWGATDPGGPWRRRAGGGGGGGASATLRDEGVELLHDSEGAFDIFRYWVTGSEEQEWHFQAGLSRESHQKPKRIILFTQLASLGEGGGGLVVCLYSARTVHEMLQVSILKWLHPKQPVVDACPI